MMLRDDLDPTFLEPGSCFLPQNPDWLWAVVGEGVVVTMFDRSKRRGGMVHYARPRQEAGSPCTAVYGTPAILALTRLLEAEGSRKSDLEAQVYGGACAPEHPGYIPHLHSLNIQTALNVLKRQEIRVTGMEVGGTRGRKIGFHTGTGETAIAKVNHIRESDWYPRFLN